MTVGKTRSSSSESPAGPRTSLACEGSATSPGSTSERGQSFRLMNRHGLRLMAEVGAGTGPALSSTSDRIRSGTWL